MIKPYLPTIAAILVLISPIVYIKAILSGRAKPHRTTRLMIFVIALVSATALFAQGNYNSLWFACASSLQAGIILALSIKHGMGGGSKLDIACLVLALAGLVLWQLTKQPILALYFAILADFIGNLPALIKTYKHPQTEIWSYYLFDVVGSTLILIATSSLSISKIAYPAYILIINALFIVFILWNRPMPTTKGTLA